MMEEATLGEVSVSLKKDHTIQYVNTRECVLCVNVCVRACVNV